MRRQYAHMRNQKGLATWVKILIGVMVIGTISVVVIIGGLVYFAGSSMKSMMDPTKVKATANTIAKFDDPLPTGWKYTMGLDLLGMSVAVLNNDSENLNLTFLKLPKGGKDISNEEILGEYAEKGVPNISGVDAAKTSAPLTVKERGKLTVGGEEMPFVSGESSSKGNTFSQFIGCVIPKANPQVIIVQGISLKSETFKLEAAKKLLSAIKSF